MFKKLRIKFVAISIMLITIIVVCICLSIYAITKKNSEYMIFNRLSEDLSNVNIGKNISPSYNGPMEKDKIVVIYDKKQSTLRYTSSQDIDENILVETVKDALAKGKEEGFVNQGDYTYAYVFKNTPIGIQMVLQNNDIYLNTIERLIITCIVIGFISVVLLSIFSIIIVNKAIKPVEESYNSQRRFIADASHELKTPLAVVKTNIDLLKSNKTDTIANQQKWIDYIEFQTNRMSKLVSDLLYLAKADNNEVLGNITTFNISDAVMNQLLSFEAILYENDLKLQCHIEDDINFIGDKEGINQIVGVFIDNAIKHAYKNTDIDVTLEKKHEKIYFSVKNIGETIAKDDIENIFDRFYRVDKSRAREKGGYGLGLSIAKSIVKRHKGKIKVKSENNVTIFFVEFPVDDITINK